MSVSDLITLLKPYGLAGVLIAVLASVIAVLYRQSSKAQTKTLEEAQERARRLEEEVRSLNRDLQRYLTMGLMVRQTMDAAVNEMRVIQDDNRGTPGSPPEGSPPEVARPGPG